MAFATFMAGPAGRGLRGAVGALLLVLGIVIGGGGGVVLAIVGAGVLALAAFNICLLGPLFKIGLRPEARTRTAKH